MNALPAERLDSAFFRRPATDLARSLLGQRLVRVVGGRRIAGRIVETEAYLGRVDKAAHSYRGRTERNASMWGPAGTAYVYLIYGMHHCMNVVAGEEGDPVAVLVRALEPEEGADLMASQRLRAKRPTDLCSGPGKLAQALGIDRRLDGVLMTQSDALFVERCRRRTLPARLIGCGPRVGVAYAEEWAKEPLRFWVRDNPHVSRQRGG